MLPKEALSLDLYRILKIYPDATQEEIKKAYNERINNSPEYEHSEIKLAYEILCNPEMRKEYNEKIFSNQSYIKETNNTNNNNESVNFNRKYKKANIFNVLKNIHSILRSAPLLNKIFMIIAIIYFISPYDIFPDFFIPGIGYADDIILLLLAYLSGYNKLN